MKLQRNLWAFFVWVLLSALLLTVYSETQAAPARFKLTQFEQFMQQYESLLPESTSPDTVLIDHLIFPEHIDLVATALSHFVRGQFLDQSVSCAGVILQDPALRFKEIMPQQRLASLRYLGAQPFWSATALMQLNTLYPPNATGQSDSPVNVTHYSRAYCLRLNALAEAFRSLQDLDAQTIQDWTLGLHQNPHDGVVLFNPNMLEAKVALFRYQNELLLSASNPETALHQSILTWHAQPTASENPILPDDNVRAQVSDLLYQQIIREKSRILFTYFVQLPDVDKYFLSEQADDDFFKDAYAQALQSYEALTQMQQAVVAVNLNNDLNKQSNDPVASVEQVEQIIRHETRIRSFVERHMLPLLQQQRDAVLSMNVPVAREEECELADIAPSKQIKHHNTWGILPSPDQPVGYRFTARPLPLTEADQRYEVKFELLLYRQSVGYANQHLSAAYDDDPCEHSAELALNAIDMGLRLVNVRRNASSSERAKGFVNDDFSGKRSNLLIQQEMLVGALESLGLHAGWLNRNGQWIIDQHFQNIALETHMPGLDTIVFLEEGEWVFDPVAQATRLCKAIEADWSNNGLTAELRHAVLIQSALNPQSTQWDDSRYVTSSCTDSLQPLHDGLPAPVPNSPLILKLPLVMQIPEADASLRWPFVVAVNATPNREGRSAKWQVKSWIFDETPDSINHWIDASLHTWLRDTQSKYDETRLNVSARLGWRGAHGAENAWDIPLLIEIQQPGCAIESIAAKYNLQQQSFAGQNGELQEQIAGVLSACPLRHENQDKIQVSPESECESIENRLNVSAVNQGQLWQVSPAQGLPGPVCQFKWQNSANRVLDLGLISLISDDLTGVYDELQQRLAMLLKDYALAKANEFAPMTAEDIQVDLQLQQGEVKAISDLQFQFRPDMSKIPASMSLLSSKSPVLHIDESYLNATLVQELGQVLNTLIAIRAQPIGLEHVKYFSTANRHIYFTADIAIDLDILGHLQLHNLFIFPEGLQSQTVAEFSLQQDIRLIPEPHDLYIHKPRIYYDFQQQQVGARGQLLVASPKSSTPVKVDAHLSVNDSQQFNSSMNLQAEMLMDDDTALMQTQGRLDFVSARVEFESIVQPNRQQSWLGEVKGVLEGSDDQLKMDTDLNLFGLNLNQAAVHIDMADCSEQCLNAHAPVKLSIGQGQTSVESDPMMVAGVASSSIDLNLRETHVAKAHLRTHALKNALTTRLFNRIPLHVITPTVHDMSEKYLLEVFALVLDVSPSIVMTMIQNPNFVLQESEATLEGRARLTSPQDQQSESDQNGDVAGQESETSTPVEDASNTSEEQMQGGSISGDELELSALPAEFLSQQRASDNSNFVVACNRESKTWGEARFSQRNGWSYHSIYYLNEKSFAAICAEQFLKDIPINDVFIVYDTFRPIKSKAEYEYNRDEVDMVCPEEASLTFRDCYTRISYDLSYSVDARANMELQAKPFAPVTRLFVRSTKPEALRNQTSRIDIEIKEPIYARLFQQLSSLNAETEATLLANRSVQAEIKQVLEEQHGLKVQQISGIQEKALPPLFFWEKSKTYKVEYVTVPVIPSYHASEHMMIWASIHDDKVGETILATQCGSFRQRQSHQTSCQILEGDAWNEKAFKLLQHAQPKIVAGEVILSPRATGWMLNSAIPALLNQQAIPRQGRLIRVDKGIAECEVHSIQLTEMADEIIYFFERALPETPNRIDLSSIRLPKLGAHQIWTASNNKEYLDAMGSFLGCQAQPAEWLKQHIPWLTPKNLQSNQINGLFFVKRSRVINPYETVVKIQADQAPRTFQIQRFSPYRTLFDDDQKVRLYQLLEQHQGTRLSMLTNQREDWEILTIENDQKTYLEIRQKHTDFCYDDQNNRTPCPVLEGKLFHSYSLASSRLDACLTALTVSDSSVVKPSRLLVYLQAEDPLDSYGEGPLKLFNQLYLEPSYQCSF